GETTPGETTPGETTPGETTPGETTPGETTPGETTPGETTPGETTPGETTNLDPVYVLGNQVLIEVSKENIQVTSEDADAWQNTADYPRGVQNIINGDIGDINLSGYQENYSLTELKWSGKQLPQKVHFTFTSPENLERLEIYKRLNNNGTLTKFSVTVFGENDQIIGQEEDVTVGKDEPVGTYSLANYSDIKKVTVTFKEAVNASGAAAQNTLTVKGISFFKKDSGIRGTQISPSTISPVAENPSAFQPNYGVDKLTDGKYSTSAELKWSPDSHNVRLSQKVILNLNNPSKLSGLTVYTRPDIQGTVMEYDVITKFQGTVVERKTITDVPSSATLSNVALSGQQVDSVELDFKAARDASGNRTNKFLTVREVKLYQADPLPLPPSPEDTETTPGETTPGETTPGETTPGETTPGETTPGETTPGETTPGETTPGETTPGE
ncbi:TPA: hypothetical protein ACGOTT_002337, partial [Streptococcus suis]